MTETASTTVWLERGGVLDASGRLRAFEGQPAGMPGALLTPLLGSGVLKASGSDRLDFVHGQVSCAVKNLPAGGFSEGLMLNHKGHALAQLRVLRRNEALLLVVDGGATAAVARRLQEHIIFDQVILEPQPSSVLSLQGEAADEVLAAVGLELPEAGAVAETALAGAPLLLHRARRSGAGGYDLLVPTEQAGAVFDALVAAGALPAGEAALELARVLAGVPDAEHEAGEGVLPQEAGLEPLVDYRKGCYLGQEIMARIEARGKLRRSLQGLRLRARPEKGVRDVLANGKTVGRLGTVAEHPQLGVVALAVLRDDLAEVELMVGTVAARAATLPFDAPSAFSTT